MGIKVSPVVATCSLRRGRWCRESSRSDAGGGICPQLDVPHWQAGTDIVAAVSIMCTGLISFEGEGWMQTSLFDSAWDSQCHLQCCP